MKSNTLQINLLGTSFTVASEDDPDYLQKVLEELKGRIEETRLKVGVDDPLKVSILTSLFLTDELMRKDSPSKSGDVEDGTLDYLISEIDNAIK